MGNEITAEVDERLLNTQLAKDATRRALADPLPGDLFKALLPEPIAITESIKVRPIVASDWKILKQLDSPIYRLALEMQKDAEIRDDIDFTDEEEWEMCWQFTHSPKENRELIAKGRSAYRTVAETFADNISMPVMAYIIGAVTKQVFDSSATVVKYGAEPAEKKMTSPMVQATP